MIPIFFKKKNLNWKDIIKKLVVENCLSFGQHSRLTSKNVTKYLIGKRVTTEIFKLYELRYLLLKIYPLIHNLFYNPRLNSSLEKKPVRNLVLPRALNFTSYGNKIFKNKSVPKFITKSRKKKQNLKKEKFLFKVKQKNLLPQILFATTTSAFASIIKNAAQICNMPCHQNRWFNGFMTAGMLSTSKKNLWKFLDDFTQNQICQYITFKWKTNQENYEKAKEKNIYYGQSRWPSLVIIPDLSNNLMIVREAKKLNIPVIGMVNSHCNLTIDYPIFAQDQTIQSVHFFCYFLATLVAKENVYFQHKRYILRRPVSKLSTLIVDFSSKKRKIFFLKRKKNFQALIRAVNENLFRQKNLFFNGIKPIKKKHQVQQKLLKRPYIFSPATTKKKLSPIQKYIFKNTPPQNLLLKLLYLYLKTFIKFKYHNKTLPFSFKELINFYRLKLNNIKNESLINIEKKKRYMKNQQRYFWNVKEKNIFWRQLQNYTLINKIIHKQWKTPSFKPKYRSWLQSTYYWAALQQWHNDPKWSGHKYILESIMIHKPYSYDLMIRQRVGPKWKSRLKSYIKSRSYKYVPRDEYLIDEEKKNKKDWITKILFTTTYLKKRKKFNQNHNFKKYFLKALQPFTKTYYKKKKNKYQKIRRTWYKH